MLVPHLRLESLTQVERCGELKMFLLDMWRHVPPSVLPTSLSFPSQISTQINEKSNSPNLRMYTFCQVSLMKTVIYTNMISQRNPAGHTGITVVTTDGEVHMFPLNVLHNILSQLLPIVTFQTNPNLFPFFIQALSYFPPNLGVNI